MAGYIGSKVAVVSSGAERKKVFTATSGQTSFTGLSYTVNNVHVFQNGVRLVDGTDYTATNGNSITLTVGAAADDQVVVVSYNTFQTSDTVSASTGGTFAGDVNFTGAFTSQGIDDNATSTAMTLDASGNLLVGKTATDSGTVGFEAAQDGHVYVTVNNTLPFYINRQSGDEMLRFASNGTTVGSIGYISSGLYIDGEGGHAGLRFGGADISPRDGGADADAAIQLGSSSNRFTDLYLSGGVYLGGTGASNKLDDYEEGTWTPAFSGATSVTHDIQVGRYTKVGSLVHLEFTIGTTSISGSQTLLISGLPFTQEVASNQVATRGEFESIYLNYSNLSTARYGLSFSAGKLTIRQDNTGGGNSALAYSDVSHTGLFEIRGSITYRTAT